MDFRKRKSKDLYCDKIVKIDVLIIDRHCHYMFEFGSNSTVNTKYLHA